MNYFSKKSLANTLRVWTFNKCVPCEFFTVLYGTHR